MRVQFRNWQPDLQGLTNPGMSDAKNVIPLSGAGYGPVKSLSALSTTGLNAKCMGAFAAQDSTGTTNSFAGDASKLYKLTAAAFADVSKVGGYTVAGTERWEFAQFGQRVIATEISDNIQYYDLGSSTIFADLGGSPPRSRHITVIRDFVVLANTTNSPNEVYWSAFNNSGAWTKGTSQCDSQTLQGGGSVQAIVGGEVGYIFQERAITRMTYVGPPLIFQFDLVEQARGLIAPGAIVTVGGISFFRGQDGFYAWDGAQSTPIGNNKVDAWFNTNLSANTSSLISAGVDPVNKLVMWSFVSTDTTDASHPDTLLFYNWISQEWSYAKIAHELIYGGLAEGWTLEQIGAAYSTLELVPVSFDSKQWAGGLPYLAAFDTNHQLAAFTGSNLAATIDSGDGEPTPNMRSLVTNARPLSDTSAATVTVRSRERLADTTVDSVTSSMQSNGDCPLLASGRYFRASVGIPAASTWTYVSGLDFEAQPDGAI